MLVNCSTSESVRSTRWLLCVIVATMMGNAAGPGRRSPMSSRFTLIAFCLNGLLKAIGMQARRNTWTPFETDKGRPRGKTNRLRGKRQAGSSMRRRRGEDEDEDEEEEEGLNGGGLNSPFGLSGLPGLPSEPSLSGLPSVVFRRPRRFSKSISATRSSNGIGRNGCCRQRRMRLAGSRLRWGQRAALHLRCIGDASGSSLISRFSISVFCPPRIHED